MSGVLDFKNQRDYVNYSKNVQHSYSKAVKKLFDLVESYLPDVEKAAAEGKTEGIYMNEFSALAYACDMTPVFHTELGRLADRNAITIAENHFMIPRDACSMLGSLLGEYYLRKNGPINKIVTTTSFCEVLSSLSELLKFEGYKVHKFDGTYLPPKCTREKYEQLVQYLKNELLDIVDFISDGKGCSEEKLRSILHRANRINEKLGIIMELRIKKPTYIRSLATMYLLSGMDHYFGKPDEYEQLLDDLIEELKDDTIEYPHSDKVTPLIWLGGRGQEFSVYNAIDDCGGAVLAFLFANTERRYREDIDPIEALARYELGEPGAVSKSAALENQQESILNIVRNVGAKGVIHYGYVGCSMGGVEDSLLREFLKKNGVTMLTINGTFQVGPPSGQLITRVSAFMEMLR